MSRPWLLLPVLAVLYGVVRAVITIAADKEYDYWAPRLAAGVIRTASLLLPRASRDRYRQEWLAELQEASDQGGALSFGLLEVLWGTPGIAARLAWNQANLWSAPLGFGLLIGLLFSQGATWSSALVDNMIITTVGIGLICGLAVAMVDVLGVMPVFAVVAATSYGGEVARVAGLTAALGRALAWGVDITLGAVLIGAMANRMTIKLGGGLGTALGLGPLGLSLGFFGPSGLSGVQQVVVLIAIGLGASLGVGLGATLAMGLESRWGVAILALIAGLVYGPIYALASRLQATISGSPYELVGLFVALLVAVLGVGVGVGLVWGPVYRQASRPVLG